MNNKYRDCIEKCLECAAVCNHCAASCLKEPKVEMMRKCIQLDLECESICISAARIMSLDGDHVAEVCRICATICEACGIECKKHDNDHCRECASVCLTCSDLCMGMAA